MSRIFHIFFFGNFHDFSIFKGQMDSSKRILERSHGKTLPSPAKRNVAQSPTQSHSHATLTQRSRMVENLRRLLSRLNQNDLRQCCGQVNQVFQHDFHLDRDLILVNVVGFCPSCPKTKPQKISDGRQI